MSIKEIEPVPESPPRKRSAARRIVGVARLFLATMSIVAAAIFFRWVYRSGGPDDALAMLWMLPVTAVVSVVLGLIVSEATMRPTNGTSGAIGVAAIWFFGHVLVVLGALLVTAITHFSGGDGYGAIYGWSAATMVVLDGLFVLALL